MVLPSNYGEGNFLNNITGFVKYGIPLADVFDTVFLIELPDILLDLHCDVVFLHLSTSVFSSVVPQKTYQ